MAGSRRCVHIARDARASLTVHAVTARCADSGSEALVPSVWCPNACAVGAVGVGCVTLRFAVLERDVGRQGTGAHAMSVGRRVASRYERRIRGTGGYVGSLGTSH